VKDFFGRLFAGAGIGFLIGGPMGAILGAALAGSMSETDKLFGGSVLDDKERVLFTSHLAVLLTLVARADDSIAPEEARAIADFFRNQLGFGERELADLRTLMKETIRRNPDPRQIAAEFARVSTPEERLALLRLIYMVAGADAPVNAREERVINRIAEGLGIKGRDHAGAAGEFRPGAGDDAYAVLGLTPDASDEEVRTAYRSMAKQYHPDRVSHLGEEFVRLAHEKFSRINEAYDRIRKERGL
jgi:DnaJ like chaperone protein